MRTGKFALGIVVVAACIALALVLSTCGGSNRVAPRPGGVISLDEALAELEGMECREGVDEALWGKLKDALSKALAERTSSVGVYPPLAGKIHELPSGEKAGRPSGLSLSSSLSLRAEGRVEDGDPVLQDGIHGE